jgi:hypothetical protein
MLDAYILVSVFLASVVLICSCQQGGSDIAVTAVVLDQPTLSLVAGGTAGTLKAIIEPSNATNNNVTWSSSDDAIATVSGGVVTPVSVGTATIRVTTTDGGKTDTCAVAVKPNPQLPADGQWFTVGQADAVDFTGNYTTGPLSLGGNPCSSLEYMKQGKTVILQGTLHWKSAPGLTTMDKVCVLPASCAPNAELDLNVVFLNNGLDVTSASDLASPDFSIKTDGSLWIDGSHEAITDVSLYIIVNGLPLQWTIK